MKCANHFVPHIFLFYAWGPISSPFSPLTLQDNIFPPCFFYRTCYLGRVFSCCHNTAKIWFLKVEAKGRAKASNTEVERGLKDWSLSPELFVINAGKEMIPLHKIIYDSMFNCFLSIFCSYHKCHSSKWLSNRGSIRKCWQSLSLVSQGNKMLSLLYLNAPPPRVLRVLCTFRHGCCASIQQ